MQRVTNLDMSRLNRGTIGFERVFDALFTEAGHRHEHNYPPYNIVKNGDKFQIEIALAGVKMEDLDIEVAENVMTISHNPEDVEDENYGEILHRGISRRKFTRKFTLNDDIVVKDAKLDNGMLYIELERIVPEEKKPRKITIKK